MMTNKKQERRSFLKHVLAGATVAAGVATSRSGKAASPKTTGSKANEILYRESDAFRKYYESLR